MILTVASTCVNLNMLKSHTVRFVLILEELEIDPNIHQLTNRLAELLFDGTSSTFTRIIQ